MSLLSVGTSALLTSQGGLATTSHNISNVNTEGYVRQRTDQATLTPNYYGNQYFGSGVQITSVERMYNSFLSSQIRSYTSQEAQQNAFMTYSQQVDDVLGSSQLGISTGLDAFFNSVNELANDPTSIAARQVVITQGDLLADRFNTLDNQLVQLDQQVNTDLTVSVNDINNLARDIADMNQAILEARGNGGAEPNDLLDKRDHLINQLSELVSVTTLQESNGSINILIGNGQALVVGNSASSLSTQLDNTTTPPRVTITYGSYQVDITSQLTGGSVGGALDFRNNVIDATRSELDLLAQSLVTAFNTVHNNTDNIANGGAGSVDLNGNPGGNFFDPANITAATISVVITDPRAVAASSNTALAGPGNNENALALASLQQDSSVVTVSPGVTRTLGEHYGVLVSEVATRTRQAQASQETQATLLQQTKQRFDSISGVNLDEEAASLIKYQQAYQAASQIIVVSNTIFDTLIAAV